MSIQPQISEIDFETIKQYWHQYLWADRKSEISPTSCIARDLSIDLSLKRAPVTFLKAEWNSQLIGVVSGFKTDAQWFRMRGLYVTFDTRLAGVGEALVSAIIEEAQKKGCSAIWTLPRKSAWPFYSKQGFIKKGDWFDENMEFGPNCYAELVLS